MDYLYNKTESKSLRQNLRNHLGLPEVILWNQLKGSKLGKKFRRQYGIGNYSMDFYCPELRLAIELDGETHNSPDTFEKDKVRQKFIEEQNIKVVRFLNKDVLSNLQGVLEEIKKHL